MFARREFLKAGTLGLLGLTLPELLLADETRSGQSPRTGPRTGPRRTAKSCLLFFLEGGPSHIDLWDLKPHAPAEVRGEFQSIATRLPGVGVCEHLPRLAVQMHHFAQIRSVHHNIVDHNAGSYYALTGRSPVKSGGLIVKDEPDNFPPLGSVVARLRPVDALPPYVLLPEIMSNNGYDLPGQRAGLLGAAFDPLVIGDPSAPGYEVPGLGLPADIGTQRLAGRRELLDQLNGGPTATGATDRLAVYRERAFSLLNSPTVRAAFDLQRESPATRQRYGLPDRVDRSVEARKFGGLPHLGQTMLMARRLLEAGVRLVTVCTGRRFDQTWDTHRNHFPLLKQSILPYVDQAFAALLADLSERGLLDETLVVAMGEFGRTPRLGQITSGAGADRAGRDHWPHCYTVLLAGGPIRGGVIHGSSDAHGAYPSASPVTPEDVAATIYSALGIDPESRIDDALGRPHAASIGSAIEALLL